MSEAAGWRRIDARAAGRRGRTLLRAGTLVILLAGSASALASHTSGTGYAKGYRPSEGRDTPLGWVRTREAGWTELGVLFNRDSREDLTTYVNASGHVEWRPRWWDNVEMVAGLRADVYGQAGADAYTDVNLDYDEVYARIRFGKAAVTLGSQHVIWGRIDEVPPSDRLSVQDLSRYVLDRLPDRRRATPAARFEYTGRQFKADALLVPFFRSAVLPDRESIWFPVDQRRGRIAGIAPSNPLLREGIRQGTVGHYDDFDHFGGFGVRLSRTAEEIDYAVTVQRARQSLPYYELDPAVRAAALSGKPLGAALAAGSGPTLREVHPLTWAFGGDFAFDAFVFQRDWTVRFEGTYLTDVPITTEDLRRERTAAVEWAGGLEFYPGDSDTRVNLQLLHRELLTDQSILDHDRTVSFLGEIERPFGNDRWRWITRFLVGLNYADYFLSSEVRYIGREPHEFYIGAAVFSGAASSLNGFYSENDQITLGWRARF